MRRWTEEGPAGLEDKKRGRPGGVRKVDLRAMVEVRKMQENPELGAYRMRAALEQVGIRLSVRTVGRILAANREAEGLPKPKRSPPQPKLFALEEALGDAGWLKALALDGYAARTRARPEMLQQAPFAHTEAL